MTTRGQGRIFKRPGSQMFWVAFYLRGKQFRESTGTMDEKQALRFLRHRMKEVGADQLGLKKFVGPMQQRITVNDLVEALKVDYALRGKSDHRFLSNLLPLVDHFGSYRATELTSADVDKFIEHALQHGRRKGEDARYKPAKPASINRSLQLLGQAYKLAITNGRLTSAPRIRHLSEKDNVRQGFFSDADFRKVHAGLPEYLKDFCLFGYLVGWRLGEIKSLLWDEVEGDIIRLRAENSKNGECRIVTFESGELAELMQRRAAARAVKTATGEVRSRYIFHHNDSPIGDIRKSWMKACALAGVTGRLFHDLRRTAVREMIRSGVHESTARKISGHKTAGMLQRYNIQSESDIREAMQLREARIATQQQENRLAVLPVTRVVQ